MPGTEMKKHIIRMLACLALATAAFAMPICTSGVDLQTYITSGGCTYGDLLFSNITYQDNRVIGSPPIIAASSVTVTMSDPNTFTISAAGWTARNGQEAQIIWNYTVTSFNTPITALGSSYDLTGPNASALGLCQTNCPGSPLVISTGNGVPVTVTLGQPVNAGTSITVQNTVTLGPGSVGSLNHLASITNFALQGTGPLGDAPEPHTVSLLLVGIVGLAFKKLRRS